MRSVKAGTVACVKSRASGCPCFSRHPTVVRSARDHLIGLRFPRPVRYHGIRSSAPRRIIEPGLSPKLAGGLNGFDAGILPPAASFSHRRLHFPRGAPTNDECDRAAPRSRRSPCDLTSLLLAGKDTIGSDAGSGDTGMISQPASTKVRWRFQLPAVVATKRLGAFGHRDRGQSQFEGSLQQPGVELVLGSQRPLAPNPWHCPLMSGLRSRPRADHTGRPTD